MTRLAAVDDAHEWWLWRGACNLRCVNIFLNYFLELLSQAAWVGAAELVEGLPPAHDSPALDETGGLVGPLPGLLDGDVTGRQIELMPGQRIVQAWRFPV